MFCSYAGHKAWLTTHLNWPLSKLLHVTKRSYSELTYWIFCHVTRTLRLKSVKVVSDMVFTEVLFHYVSSFSFHLFDRKKSLKESKPLDLVFITYVKGVLAFKCVRNDITLEQSSGCNICTFQSLNVRTRCEGNPQPMTYCVQHSGLQQLHWWNKQTTSRAFVLIKSLRFSFVLLVAIYCEYLALLTDPLQCWIWKTCQSCEVCFLSPVQKHVLTFIGFCDSFSQFEKIDVRVYCSSNRLFSEERCLFWDIMLCCWVVSFHLLGLLEPEDEGKALWFSETSALQIYLTQCSISEIQNVQQHCCDNLSSCPVVFS
jgi:hypothetical protein